MGQDARFEKWAGGILGAVSLLLALHLAWSYALRHGANTRARMVALQAAATHPTPQGISSAQNKTAHEAAPVVEPLTHHHAPPASAAPRRDSSVTRAASDAAPAPIAIAQSLAVPPPATKEFQAIGYVEKPDGTRQAVISEGNQVFVVHDGEIFDEHYRVLSISSSTVEAADLTVPQPAPSPAPSALVMSALLAKPADTAASAASAKPLGYVERPGRPPESIVAERDDVRLVPQSTETEGSLVAQAPSAPANGHTQASLASSQLSGPTGLPADKTDPTASAAVTSLPVMPAVNGSASETEANVDVGSGELPVAGTNRPSSGPESNLPNPPGTPVANPAESSYQILNAFCYVEGEETGRQAFVAFGNSVYSVREGTVFADRYRVMKISPEGVEVADAGAQTRPPPAAGEVLAQNRITNDGAFDLGNHSPPAELPWNDFVRSVGFLWSNSAATGGSFGAEPALLANNRIEPTSDEVGSSSLLVGVGPPTISLNDQSIRSAEIPLEGSSAKKDQAGSIKVLTSTFIKANGPGSSAPTTSLDGTHVSPSSNAGISAPAVATSATLFSAPISRVSGRDLLLPFSVGDNGCSIP